MKPTTFSAQTAMIKQGETEIPLTLDQLSGIVTTCWQASWRERWQMFRNGGRVYIQFALLFHGMPFPITGVDPVLNTTEATPEEMAEMEERAKQRLAENQLATKRDAVQRNRENRNKFNKRFK